MERETGKEWRVLDVAERGFLLVDVEDERYLAKGEARDTLDE